jgi:hypothetical protein
MLAYDTALKSGLWKGDVKNYNSFPCLQTFRTMYNSKRVVAENNLWT